MILVAISARAKEFLLIEGSGGPLVGFVAASAGGDMALHSAWGVMALYTASPLRTFEDKLGVQAPVGVCDPSGFTAVGNFEYLACLLQLV